MDLTWIVGGSRTGSTWLARMLGDLGAGIVDDPHLGHHLSVWRPISLAYGQGDAPAPGELTTLPELRADDPHYFFNREHARAWVPHLRALIAARLEAQHPEGKIVVKDPGVSGVARLISGLFPLSGFIWLIRDPRDVVDSWMDGYGAEWGRRDGTYELEPGSRTEFAGWQAAVWAHRFRECRAAYNQHRGPKTLMRYEDLLEDPAGLLAGASVVAGIGEDVTVMQVAAAAKRNSFDNGDPTGDGERKRSARPGRWRERLTDQEEAAVYREARSEMLDAGYL